MHRTGGLLSNGSAQWNDSKRSREEIKVAYQISKCILQ